MVGVWKTCFLLLFFDGSDALLLGARNKISTLAIGMFDWSWTDNLERNECMFFIVLNSPRRVEEKKHFWDFRPE